jgi:hypothetical protein
VALAAAISLIPFCCTQPGTPIPEHQTRGLPEGFPSDFPLHARFYVTGTARKLDWTKGDYFIVKFVTELKLLDIDYFFRKKLGTDRGYEIVHESAIPPGGARLVFEKGSRRVDVTFDKEQGRNTILLRLKDRKEGGR